MRTQAILLDMGGVLLDMGNDRGLPLGRHDYRGREALAHAIRRAGGRVDTERLEEILFSPWRRDYETRHAIGREAAWDPHLKRLRRATGVHLRNLTLLAAWFAPYAETVVAVPGAAATVRALAGRGFKLAIVSNVPLPGQLYARLLKRHGILTGAPSLHWSYDAGTRKPSPALVRAALAALGVAPEAAVMVGDRRGADVAAGRAAGTRTVWVRSADGGGPQPDATIGTLEELPGILESWS